ncbi:MAG TPA: type II toxin-antitoxin system prevent-host-death family antitoxin [Solirubrobacteraceae bacterium]|jgi:prevent-host-death family protein|nr:type II toxin-antitoxin system prevent-host-death family antitoxin [Solirubrobacteraceae bacterium]
MRSIGIRELRQQASKHLRDVERGETIEVTDRGRPVALLVPVPRTGTAERLIASGRMTAPEHDLFALGEPLEPRAGGPLPSEVLAALRAEER